MLDSYQRTLSNDPSDGEEWQVPYYLTPGTILPSVIRGEAVTWQVSLSGMLNDDAILLAPSYEMSAEFLLTASTSNEQYNFAVRVIGADHVWLAGYTRQPDSNPNVYSRFVASSLHLALNTRDNEFEPLNSGYGVLFPKADYSASTAGETRLLTEPRLFRRHPQGFGVLAKPLNYAGEALHAGELLYFETEDLVHYEEKGMIKLTDAEIEDFSCERDAAVQAYRIGWSEQGGRTYWVTTEDFIHFAPAKEGHEFPITQADVSISDANMAQLLALTTSEAEYLYKKLGRVRNVSVQAPTIMIRQGTTSPPIDSIRAAAHYSDGSISYKRMTVSEDELAALDLSKPGEYKLNARVVRTNFPYPMMRTRPDPFVLLYQGRYYFIATDDDGQRRIYIRSAETLEGLEDGRAAETLLWDGNLPSGERHGQHWAPELHVINGKLYCFLAISVNNDWRGVQAHVVELTGTDPMNPAHWDTPRRVLNRHGKFIADLADREHSISLDMTYFEHKGQSYVCWSQPVWFGDDRELASLYIATIHPDEPWRLTSDPVRICRNEYGWDRNGGAASGVSEGAYILKRDDRLFMVFSGSNVGPNYTVGILELIAEGDPLEPNAWRKSNYPLMHSLSLPGQYGPGHNMFVQDEHGDWYNVYHACGIDGGRRNASIRPLHWRFDGSPILDMRDEEDLLPELETITLTIKVQ
ncbi:family 43 glycosylhydrolase [Paenibacillus sp. PR3]|uniref:Family 43 glycosylhydrolase n=1 Tax=Paenibacillus terricola TaxID=2763503 RepID=A0ABR8N0N4_9BACL|nr:family 43 glycosylhydrolase [Paenibacillus terricola]MBD3921755.1 family 43 glycosylhydrolase [Paenibacillus terricola]